MKYLKLLLILLLFLVTSCTCPIDNQTKDMEKLRAAIDQFYVGIETGNGDMVMELFADNMIQMPDGWNIKQGKENIESGFRAGLEAGFRLKDVETKKLVIKGDIAYKIAEYYWGMIEDGKETKWYRTKNIHIWEKQSDDSWKLTADMWNEDPE